MLLHRGNFAAVATKKRPKHRRPTAKRNSKVKTRENSYRYDRILPCFLLPKSLKLRHLPNSALPTRRFARCCRFALRRGFAFSERKGLSHRGSSTPSRSSGTFLMSICGSLQATSFAFHVNWESDLKFFPYVSREHSLLLQRECLWSSRARTEAQGLPVSGSKRFLAEDVHFHIALRIRALQRWSLADVQHSIVCPTTQLDGNSVHSVARDQLELVQSSDVRRGITQRAPELIAFVGDDAVPAVLLSGHHADIARWRREQSLRLTLQRRPDLIDAARAAGLLSKTDEKLLATLLAE